MVAAERERARERRGEVTTKEQKTNVLRDGFIYYPTTFGGILA